MRVTNMLMLCTLALALSQGPSPSPPPPLTLAFNYSNTLSDHAVLQRAVPASVFGFGPVFAGFTVTIVNGTGGGTINGIIGSDGTWRVQLPPQPASGPFLIWGNLTPGYWVPANATLSWVLHDIWFGDVIICGGQSNMAFGLGGCEKAPNQQAPPLTRLTHAQPPTKQDVQCNGRRGRREKLP
jgi:hypothetical protein